MPTTDFFIFKKNTDAIATNRGFYYQYLATIKLWLKNYLENENEIYCEREDDILEINPTNNTRSFHQIKCYAEDFGLNSSEIKSSLLNFYSLFLQYKDTYTAYFYFETNTDFKSRAGQLIKEWYEKQQQNNFEVTDYIEETRAILLELVQKNLDKYLKNLTDTDAIEKAQLTVSNFEEQIKSDEFITFVEKIRWEFAQEKDTEKAIEIILVEIKETISKLKYDKEAIKEKFILAYLLHTVIEKSTANDENKRLLNKEILQNILNSTNTEIEFRKEVIQLMNNNFHTINEKLDNIEETGEDSNKTVHEIQDLLLKYAGTPQEIKIDIFILTGLKSHIQDNIALELACPIPYKRNSETNYKAWIPYLSEDETIKELLDEFKEKTGYDFNTTYIKKEFDANLLAKIDTCISKKETIAIIDLLALSPNNERITNMFDTCSMKQIILPICNELNSEIQNYMKEKRKEAFQISENNLSALTCNFYAYPSEKSFFLMQLQNGFPPVKNTIKGIPNRINGLKL